MQEYQQQISNQLNQELDLHLAGECSITCILCESEIVQEIEEGDKIYDELIVLEQAFHSHLIHRSFISYPQYTKIYCSYCLEEYHVLKMLENNSIV
jgi:hypothetical protein